MLNLAKPPRRRHTKTCGGHKRKKETLHIKWKHSVEKPVSYFLLYRHPVCAYDFFKYGSGFLNCTSHQLMLFAIDTRFTWDQILNELWWSINIFIWPHNINHFWRSLDWLKSTNERYCIQTNYFFLKPAHLPCMVIEPNKA